MRRLLLAVGLALMAGCSAGPTESYQATVAAAQSGDRDAFLDGFTERSRDLVDAMLRLSDAYGVETTNPYELLIYDSVDGERIEGDGERAVLLRKHGAPDDGLRVVRSHIDLGHGNEPTHTRIVQPPGQDILHGPLQYGFDLM